MNVFCPDCKAEYKVNERSSLNTSVKFICYECKSSWIDNTPRENEGNENKEPKDDKTDKDGTRVDSLNNPPSLLNSLALAEINNSFGQGQSEDSLDKDSNNDLAFDFETLEREESTQEITPSQSFPDLERESSNSVGEPNQLSQVKNNEEIAIEKRLKESTELLKKAREEPKDTDTHTKKHKKTGSLIVYISGLLVLLIFTVNLALMFKEEIIESFPFTAQYLTILNYYSELIFGLLERLYFKITDFFITNLA
tara:strand:+ start:984 stop:1742 length:759 start_codon:yes stop_codon:yes gene_type:complete